MHQIPSSSNTNNTPALKINKINTHSIQGVSFFIERYYLSQYTTRCQLRRCLTCNNWFFFIFPDVSKFFQLLLTVAGSSSCLYKYCVLAANVTISINNLHIHSYPSSSCASYQHLNPHHEIKHLTYIAFENEIYKWSMFLSQKARTAYSGLCQFWEVYIAAKRDPWKRLLP